VLPEELVPSTKDYDCKVGIRGRLLDLLHNDGVEVCDEQLVWNYDARENCKCERSGLVSRNVSLGALLRLLDGGVLLRFSLSDYLIRLIYMI
jgi:hypothetical protein